MANNYHFITRWRVKGNAAEVFDIISAPLEYPRWWPSVYLDVRQMKGGLHPRYDLLTRGWMPYTLHWQAATIESRPPQRVVIQAHGDFNGRGIWSMVEDGAFVDITFDWKLEAEKPLLRYLTPVLRPAFEANHRWAMEQGRQSLELELARYRAGTAEEMNSIPAPIGPKKLFTGGVAAGAVLAAGLVAGIVATHPHDTPAHDTPSQEAEPQNARR